MSSYLIPGTAAGNTWADNTKRADAAIAEVRRVYAAGLKAVDVFFPSSEQKQALVNMQKLGPVIETWAGQHRAWAEQGGRLVGGDGSKTSPGTWSKYSWETWLAEGKDHAHAVKVHTSASYDAGIFTGVVKPAIAASANETKELAKDAAGELKKWAPWVLGAVALLAIAVISTNARSVVGAVR